MKNSDFIEKLGDIDEKFIKEAAPRKRANTPLLLRYGSIAASFILVASALFVFLPKMLGGNGSHVHKFGEWTVSIEATCQHVGERIRSCECGETEREELPITMHVAVDDPGKAPTCGTPGTSAGAYCAHCGLVITECEILPATGEHNFVNNKCTVCGAEDNNFAYSLNADGKSYTVIGIGAYKNHANIIIPNEY